MIMRHDDHLREEEMLRIVAPAPTSAERARLADGRARLQARLAAEAERMNRRWLPLVSPARWVGAAAVAAIALAVASAVPRRAADSPRVPAGVEAGALPVPALTPGATIDIDVRDVCDDTPRPPQEIGAAVRAAVLRSYRMESVPPDQYELDYLITPQLGGAPDRRNLWPQRYGARVWHAGVKDQLEDLLPRLVCEGRVDLRTAQREIAADWVAAYRKYFRTVSPLRPASTLASLSTTGPLLLGRETLFR
jgi:hypothetical protein